MHLKKKMKARGKWKPKICEGKKRGEKFSFSQSAWDCKSFFRQSGEGQ